MLKKILVDIWNLDGYIFWKVFYNEICGIGFLEITEISGYDAPDIRFSNTSLILFCFFLFNSVEIKSSCEPNNLLE